ncbi:MAG: IS5 family transposase [archaeon]
MISIVPIEYNSFFRLASRAFSEARFPLYFSNFSKKTYGNFVHVFLHVYKERTNASYDRLRELVIENKLTRMLGIKSIPHKSNMSRFLKKIDKEVLREMIRACARIVNIIESKSIIDSTGFSLTNPSHYYLKRINGKSPKNFVKTSLLVDSRLKIVLNAQTHSKNVHDINDFIPLINEMRGVVKNILADKAYDSTNVLEYCKLNGINPMIPVREWKNFRDGYGAKPRIGGKLRRKMFENFDAKEYARRNIVESINSAIKRTLGGFVRSRLAGSQEKTALFKALTYTLEIINRKITLTIHLRS